MPNTTTTTTTTSATTTTSTTTNTTRASASTTNANKKNRGQFYTTNSAYILDGFPAPPSDVARIVEPFAGKGDLIDWINNNRASADNPPNNDGSSKGSKSKGSKSAGSMIKKTEIEIEAYDIEPKRDGIQKRDTLANPPDYSDAWVITNPPYLARNKSAKDKKSVYELYGMNDLYKCFIMSVVNPPQPQQAPCRGGIFIVPAGFFFSPRTMDARCRGEFMRKYRITKVRYFEEAVFDDTATTIVAFSFERLSGPANAPSLTEQNVEWELMPSGVRKTFNVCAANDWIIGGDIYNLDIGGDAAAPVSVCRHVEGNALRADEQQTNMTLNALDSGTSAGSRICLTYKKDHVYPAKDSSRTYATFRVSGLAAAPLNEAEQMQLCDEFNELLEKKRADTWSLFLPQFRESKEYARKRIPFELAYRIFMHLLIHRILVQRR